MIRTLCLKKRCYIFRRFLAVGLIIVLFLYVIFGHMIDKNQSSSSSASFSSLDSHYPHQPQAQINYFDDNEVPLPNIMYINVSKISIHSNLTEAVLEENFFQFLVQKEVWCKKKERLGHPGEGGWNVCLPPPYGLPKPCIVYSFQTDQNWEFVDAVSFIYGCHVYVYDPSLKDGKMNRSDLMHISNVGLGSQNGYNLKGQRLKTLKTLLQSNGHSEAVISYLKIDIEYDEWASLRTAMADGSLANVKQLGFEIHLVPASVMIDGANVRPIRPHLEEYVEMHSILSKLQELQFSKFDYQRNMFGEYRSVVTNKSRSFAYELYYLNTKFAQQDYDAEV